MNESLPKRFMDKTLKTESCWLWKASITNKGYGRYKVDGKVISAHRFSWWFTNGDIPEGMYILHKCDVRKCVNPDHLFLGTHQDNMEDMIEKDRHRPGEKSARAKLNQKEVNEIRNLYVRGKCNTTSEFSMRGLAKKFKVDPGTIRDILKNKRWKIKLS